MHHQKNAKRLADRADAMPSLLSIHDPVEHNDMQRISKYQPGE